MCYIRCSAIVNADIGSQDSAGWRSLHIASTKGPEALTQPLLDRGAEMRVTANSGFTSMELMPRMGDPEATPEEEDEFGGRARDWYRRRGMEEEKEGDGESVGGVDGGPQGPVQTGRTAKIRSEAPNGRTDSYTSRT